MLQNCLILTFMTVRSSSNPATPVIQQSSPGPFPHRLNCLHTFPDRIDAPHKSRHFSSQAFKCKFVLRQQRQAKA